MEVEFTTSISKWLAMGGYAPYVWSAYGISIVALIALCWHSLRQHRRLRKDIAANKGL